MRQELLNELNIEGEVERKLISPERNLLVALLERALLDYFGNQPIEREDAALWLFEEPNSTDEFSLNWICSQLDLDTKTVLSQIRQMNPRGDLPAQQWWRIKRAS